MNLKDMTIEELTEFFENMGEKKFRAKQVFEWLHAKGAADAEEMTSLSKDLRSKIAPYISNLEIAKVQNSKTDGTRKYLFRLADGLAVESVFMKYKFGNSICVSSQAGCRMGCRFCASTIGGLKRNLTPGEIADQIIQAQRDTGERIGHVVVMGTGEPFDNYENVSKFIKIINNEKGLNIGHRNITVSTCGIIPRIYDFAEDFPQVNLAISLHASDDEKRSEIMPINNRYPIGELLKATRDYTDKTSRRITYEYTLVAGVNDSREQAEKLAKLLKGSLCHVNLIRLNEVKETGLKSADAKRAEEFRETLENRGIPATLRRELGSDIDAACGQLRLAEEK